MCSLVMANKTAYIKCEKEVFSLYCVVVNSDIMPHMRKLFWNIMSFLLRFPGWSMIRKQKNSVKLSSLHGSQQSHGKDRLIAEPTLLFWWWGARWESILEFRKLISLTSSNPHQLCIFSFPCEEIFLNCAFFNTICVRARWGLPADTKKETPTPWQAF